MKQGSGNQMMFVKVRIRLVLYATAKLYSSQPTLCHHSTANARSACICRSRRGPGRRGSFEESHCLQAPGATASYIFVPSLRLEEPRYASEENTPGSEMENDIHACLFVLSIVGWGRKPGSKTQRPEFRSARHKPYLIEGVEMQSTRAFRNVVHCSLTPDNQPFAASSTLRPVR